MAGKKTLTFDDGIVEYDINGKATARFNPTDTAFIERMWNAISDLENEQEQLQAEVDEIGEIEDDLERGERMLAYINKRDADMRKTIDGLVGEGVADALFPDMNCYAVAEGVPVWVNFMFAIADEVYDTLSKSEEQAKPRLNSYSEKYTALLNKYKKR